MSSSEFALDPFLSPSAALESRARLGFPHVVRGVEDVRHGVVVVLARQALVRADDLLELALGVGIARVFVRVVLQREFPANVGSRSVGAWSGRVREAGEAGDVERGTSLGCSY